MPRMIENLPSAKGSYALLFHLPRSLELTIGRLGRFAFSPGGYLYLGSAGGSGGLRGRLRHHLRIAERPHWHLDWLRPHLEVLAILYALSATPLECTWSASVGARRGVSVLAPNFGASDCCQGCAAHFVKLPDGFKVGDARRLLQDSSNCQVFVIIPSDSAAPQ